MTRIQQISRTAVAWLCQIVAMRYSLGIPRGCSFHHLQLFFQLSLCGHSSSAYSACVCCGSFCCTYHQIGCKFTELAAISELVGGNVLKGT
jgi:hypothetical protein